MSATPWAGATVVSTAPEGRLSADGCARSADSKISAYSSLDVLEHSPGTCMKSLCGSSWQAQADRVHHPGAAWPHSRAEVTPPSNVETGAGVTLERGQSHPTRPGVALPTSSSFLSSSRFPRSASSPSGLSREFGWSDGKPVKPGTIPAQPSAPTPPHA